MDENWYRHAIKLWRTNRLYHNQIADVDAAAAYIIVIQFIPLQKNYTCVRNVHHLSGSRRSIYVVTYLSVTYLKHEAVHWLMVTIKIKFITALRAICTLTLTDERLWHSFVFILIIEYTKHDHVSMFNTIRSRLYHRIQKLSYWREMIEEINRDLRHSRHEWSYIFQPHAAMVICNRKHISVYYSTRYFIFFALKWIIK